MSTHREVEYELNEVHERELCEREPTLRVVAMRRVVTTEHHPDGSVTRHEAPWRAVQAWTYKHEGDDE